MHATMCNLPAGKWPSSILLKRFRFAYLVFHFRQNFLKGVTDFVGSHRMGEPTALRVVEFRLK